MAEVHPCCLTIAGSDSGGNAGVQADLRAFHAYGLHGCTVFAALTAQNPRGVSAIHSVPPDFVAAHPEIARVVDPVMIATSGAKLAANDAVEAMKRRLLPVATVITPNMPEAEALCGHAGPSVELARELHGRFGCAVVVKGGHGRGECAVDVLCDAVGEIREFDMPWVRNPASTHGTGCTFAAALAAELAIGRGMAEAVAGAKRHVHDAIAGSYFVGEGCGVLGFA